MSTIEHTSVGNPGEGCFILPVIGAGIPSQLDQGRKRATVLARFATAAASAGVQLPSGDFHSVEKVVQAQWTQHVQRQYAVGSFRSLVAAPAINVSDEYIELLIEARSQLTAFQLKPVVENLEASLPGLGWFAAGVIDQASSHGHEIYSMGFVGYMIEGSCWGLDEFTDQAYARAMLMEEGSDPPDGPVDEETMERLRGDYNYWPSAVLEEVGGHGHLFGYCAAKTRPLSIKPNAVQQWLSENGRHQYAEAVKVALELHGIFKRADRDFVWNGAEDGMETIGALCFVTWDSPKLLFEAVGHHEERQYQGGDAIEAFARCRLSVNDQTSDRDMRRLAKSTVNYINRWALLEKLLSHFPTWDGDDDDV